MLRSYDHRLRDLVRSVGDIRYATRRGVPRSTARGWLTATRAAVVTHDVLDKNVLNLQQVVLALRKRVEWLVALLRLVVVLLKVSRFSLTSTRLPDEATKVSLLRAINRSRSVVPLRAVLRLLRLSQSRYHSWKREDECGVPPENTIRTSFGSREPDRACKRSFQLDECGGFSNACVHEIMNPVSTCMRGAKSLASFSSNFAMSTQRANNPPDGFQRPN
jgi:hypothetical protein